VTFSSEYPFQVKIPPSFVLTYASRAPDTYASRTLKQRC
jgi:hypothetical protein